MLQVSLPADIAEILGTLVESGEYPTTDVAAATLIRRALSTPRARPRGDPSTLPVELPPSERPIEWKPGDVNWME